MPKVISSKKLTWGPRIDPWGTAETTPYLHVPLAWDFRLSKTFEVRVDEVSNLAAPLLLQKLTKHLNEQMVWLGVHHYNKGCNAYFVMDRLVTQDWEQDGADL